MCPEQPISKWYRQIKRWSRYDKAAEPIQVNSKRLSFSSSIDRRIHCSWVRSTTLLEILVFPRPLHVHVASPSASDALLIVARRRHSCAPDFLSSDDSSLQRGAFFLCPTIPPSPLVPSEISQLGRGGPSKCLPCRCPSYQTSPAALLWRSLSSVEKERRQKKNERASGSVLHW